MPGVVCIPIAVARKTEIASVDIEVTAYIIVYMELLGSLEIHVKIGIIPYCA